MRFEKVRGGVTADIRTCVSSFVVSETPEPCLWSRTKKQVYLFYARSFLAKHGVLLVVNVWCE